MSSLLGFANSTGPTLNEVSWQRAEKRPQFLEDLPLCWELY